MHSVENQESLDSIELDRKREIWRVVDPMLAERIRGRELTNLLPDGLSDAAPVISVGESLPATANVIPGLPVQAIEAEYRCLNEFPVI